MEIGIVKSFNNKKGWGFGTVITEGGEEIFFHINNGKNTVLGDNGIRFCGGKLRREPKRGDPVVFERKKYLYGGSEASPWGFDHR